jgi:hypothetical protein
MKTFGVRLLVPLLVPCLVLTGSGARGSDVLAPRGLTVEELQEHFPQARLHAVSSEEFQAARQRYADRSVLLLDLTSELPPADVPPVDPTPAKPPLVEGKEAPPPGPDPDPEAEDALAPPAPTIPPESDPTREKAPSRVQGSPASGPSCCVGDLPDGACLADVSRGGGDAAAVVFVVIGVFVVAALIVYAPIFLYRAATGPEQRYWWDAGLTSTLLTGDDSGTLVGVKLQGGLTEGGVHIGLAGEFGAMDLKLKLRERDAADRTRSNHVGGAYGLVGPAVRFTLENPKHPAHVFLELLAGTSDRRQLRTISVARAGVSVALYERLSLGLSGGAMYTHLRKSEGLVRQNEFGYLMGVEAGYRF